MSTIDADADADSDDDDDDDLQNDVSDAVMLYCCCRRISLLSGCFALILRYCGWHSVCVWS